MHDLAVIVVTWNSRDYIEMCLKSVGSISSRITVGVVVIDNNSTDGTPQIIKDNFPEVTLINNPLNQGFAAANNVGIKRSMSRYLLLLNPDTIVRPGALEGLVGFMDSHQECWAAGPALFNGDGSPQRTGVRFPSTWNIVVESLFLDRLWPRSRIFGRHRALYEDPAKARPVDFVQGSCMIVRREVIDAVGGLDEEFFMYFEETDWCYRMKQAGGKVYYTPDGEVIHFGGGTVAHYDERRLLHYHRSLLLFYRKHSGAIAGMLVRAVLLVRSVVRMVLWGGIGISRTSLRTKALSSARGYAKVIPLLLGVK
jgi:GT2 family glycosyltransferase